MSEPMQGNQPDTSRYHRQEILPGFSRAGQERLRNSHALVVGCGALGCAIVDILARAGIGRLTIIDRDIVERTNLQRQTLFTEEDARLGRPKAQAARARVEAINSDVACRGWVEHLGPENVREYICDSDIVLDGLDNLHTRFVLNDAAVQLGKPFIYGGAVGTRGMSLAILPGGACLRCVFPDAVAATAGETCDTAGILMSAVSAVAAHQSTQAIKWLIGAHDMIDRSLWSVDQWSNRAVRLGPARQPRADCPCCAQRRFDYLDGRHECRITVLCGRNAVQVAPAATSRRPLNLDAAQRTLAAHGNFGVHDGLLRGTLREVRSPDQSPIELTLFPDGRAIVRPSTDPEFARAIYDRFVGA